MHFYSFAWNKLCMERFSAFCNERIWLGRFHCINDIYYFGIGFCYRQLSQRKNSGQNYSEKYIILCGLFAALGSFLASFTTASTSPLYLYATYGVMSGLALGWFIIQPLLSHSNGFMIKEV